MMLASSLTMAMRLWDGVTDPFVGFMVDKTNGKFGKNRPFIIIGNLVLALTSFLLFHVTHKLAGWFPFPFLCCHPDGLYLQDTCQCVVTKSAQISCLTNDPKQRPLFASFDGVYNMVLFSMWLCSPPTSPTATRMWAVTFHPKFFLSTYWLTTAIGSATCTVLALSLSLPRTQRVLRYCGKAGQTSA